MVMYALGLSVFQNEIAYARTRVKWVAYVDALSGVGKISEWKLLWNLVNAAGLET